MSENASAADLDAVCAQLGKNARAAARVLAQLGGERKNRWLRAAAVAIETHADEIRAANERDLAAAPGFGLTDAAIDRLTLTTQRIQSMADSLREVAMLPDPVGELVTASRRPNGLDVSQIRVPLGVIFFLYESRPNVTADAAALCIKSGNAVILRGGKEARHSNEVLVSLLRRELEASALPADSVQSVPTTDREAVGRLLKMNQAIDLVIPRGGESLIRRVAAEATMPVLKHFAGNCHVYIDEHADLDMAERIVVNAKTARPGVCNAAETLLVHQAVAHSFLPRITRVLREKNVELRGDPAACTIVRDLDPAAEADWDTEYLDLILAIGVVDTLDHALAHIGRHGTGHTEAIVTQEVAAARRFLREVDSSCVLVNASTRFNDGGELGLGAEIGISTDRFHARGPCGLRELTTTKWLVQGDGQIRE
jgi:glutamate-5-semialdehyde dehydrogenase